MKVWGLWATLGFAVLAFVLGQAMGFAVTLSMMKGFAQATAESNGTAIAISALVGYPVEIITLVLAARLSGTDALEYLGLDVPRWRDVAITTAGLLAVIAAGDAVTLALGKEVVPAIQLEQQRVAQADGALLWLWLAIIVAAPVGEELLFRGFMFRGFVHEPRDAVPAILVIALIWAMLHVQYDWFVIAQLFVIGGLFGFARWRTGSTTLVILLHMLLNLESLVETVIVMGRV